MKRLFCYFIFTLLFIVSSFSQTAETDGNSLFIPISGEEVYFDAEGQEISKEAFRDSINSQKYVFSVHDKARWILNRKAPRKENVTGKKIPCLKTNDIYGNEYIIGKENSFTLLVFWDTTCPPCIEELIVLNILEKEFQGLQVVAITKDSSEKVNNFMAKFHFKWNNIVILPNYKQELESVFKTRIVPVSLLLDSENTIKAIYTGNNLREMIVSLDGFY
jgi:thiol-disulfide isomerase/thioredoxin